MNYIRHLNAFFSFVRNDERLACSHVSLYLALFQYWNFNRFQNPFPVYRTNLMQLSKIGSKNTYHKCLKELHSHGYIFCNPPVTRFQPITVRMLRLDLREDQQESFHQLELFATGIKKESPPVPDLTPAGTGFGTDAVPELRHNLKGKQFLKEVKTPARKFSGNKKSQTKPVAPVAEPVHIPVTLQEVKSFFMENKYPAAEGAKFFNHYQAIGWKIKGITPITDWQAAAHKWMLNAEKYVSVLPSEFNSEKQWSLDDLFYNFLQDQKIYHFITHEHFAQLHLTISDQLLSDAISQRMNQLTGSNNYSVNQLLQAYESADPSNALLIKDEPNLALLAKRIAVHKRFRQYQQAGHQSLPP